MKQDFQSLLVQKPILPGWLSFSFLFTCLSLLSTINFRVVAQDTELRARAIDSSDLKPVAFTTVYMDEYTGTISDELGFFRLRVSPDRLGDTLNISCVGYLSKRILLRDLDLTSIDSIYLQPNIVELGEVSIQVRSKKKTGYREIIRQAIRRIPDNYPDSAILYNGYYREYIKQDDEYINLFEFIINLVDPGFQAVDNFYAGLLYKRVNNDFRIDALLMKPYDSLNKFVPHSKMPIELNNELVILRAHDPVRNCKAHSLYFIDRLETDFMRNHDFSQPKLTYLDNRPYFFISFEDNRNYTQGVDRITAKGTIYIDAINYGIKRINYRGTIEKVTVKQKLFELSLEYQLMDDRYYLHYLSFNNLFNTRHFALKGTKVYEDKLELSFNRPIDPEYAGDPDNFSVFLGEEEQEIQRIVLQQDKVLLVFNRNSKISEILKTNMHLGGLENRKRLVEMERRLLEDLRMEFHDLRDLEGNELAGQELESYYQYREFFTNQARPVQGDITGSPIVKSKPVLVNRLSGKYSGDTSWLNTPLIEEDLASRAFYSKNEKFNTFIESQYSMGENRLNDIVYIHTDREVYAPEDTLWFKAYIRNKKYLTDSYVSKTFNVMLLSREGRIIKKKKYLAMDPEVCGQFLLDHTLVEGLYYIAGYSSWMTNFETRTLFSKRIMLLKEKQDGARLIAAFDKENYFPGDTIRLLVNCYDDFNREVGDVSFTYRLITGRQVLQRGEGNTGFSVLEPISLIIPRRLDTIPRLEFSARYNKERLDTVYSLPVINSIQVDFFPEGGRCINGAETTVAFKAVTKLGVPLEIEGNIIDQEGKVLATTQSKCNGMGLFPYFPEENRKCFFKVTRPSGIDWQFALPDGMNQGWILHLKNCDNEDNELELEINNVNTENDTALLLLSVRGYPCYFDVIKTGKERSVKIPLENIPPGIAVITLFNNMLLPQAERLVFVPSDRNYRSKLETDRQQYIPRDSVILSVSLDSDQSTSFKGSYSLSITDNQLCNSDMIDEPNIISSLLLSPEIHGKIYRPNNYFDEANKDAQAHIDLLLMTQGWRNYRYLGEAGSAGAVKPESRDLITGRLLKQSVVNESSPTGGLLKILFGGNTTTVEVDNDGRFSFDLEYSPNFNTGIFLQAEDMSGQDELSIVLNSTDFEDNLTTYLDYLADSLGREWHTPVNSMDRFQDRFSLGIENHHWLEEVVIRKTVKKKELSITDLAFSKRTATQGELDAAPTMESLQYLVQRFNREGVQVYYCIDGFLQARDSMQQLGPDPAVIGASNINEGPGIKVPDYSYAFSIPPEEIQEYTIIRGPEAEALYGNLVEFVIDVKLKPFSERSGGRKWNNPVTIEKFAVVKEFYAPHYDTEEKRRSTIPDLRKTIHWEPDLHLDETGSAEVLFYNGDRYTRIKCVLEGITEEGIPIHSEHFYDVSLTRQE